MKKERQKISGTSLALEHCKAAALRFIEHGSELNDNIIAPLLDSDTCELFHIKLENIRGNRLLTLYETFNQVLGKDPSFLICNLAEESALNRKKLKELLAQKTYLVKQIHGEKVLPIHDNRLLLSYKTLNQVLGRDPFVLICDLAEESTINQRRLKILLAQKSRPHGANP